MQTAEMGRRRVQIGEMLPLLVRHEIQVLLRAGFGVHDVATRVGVSDDSARRVRREDAAVHVDDEVEHRARGIGRPSKTTAFTEKVGAWRREERELPTLELLRRAKEHGYGGSKTAFYALVAGVRPPRAAPTVRFEGLPGEFSQHDFGHVDVRFAE